MALNKDNYKAAYAEICVIFSHMSKKTLSMIPKEIINIFETEKDPEHEFVYDKSKSLNEQDMLKETRTLLSLLYRDYLASPEERKKLRERDALELKKRKLEVYCSMPETKKEKDKEQLIHKKEKYQKLLKEEDEQ